MHSRILFPLAVGLLGLNSVIAGPCKPTSLTTTSEVSQTSSQTSELSSTISETSTETETATESTESTTLTSTTEFLTTSSTTEATTTTTSAAGPNPDECTTDADCDGATPFCDAGTCVATNPNAENLHCYRS
ncbi:hypothetical protein NM208_g14122 [Fusarium decemcellulare]|uniref:Uncharacterized protein n=1 Tax=Fusarium decemcellulare TaxID=57161 RepID=A0ACC1RJ41_9HYPO|nr:hypothetical protein NM208_g14122 [Fusarium decemcellulare]